MGYTTPCLYTPAHVYSYLQNLPERQREKQHKVQLENNSH